MVSTQIGFEVRVLESWCAGGLTGVKWWMKVKLVYLSTHLVWVLWLDLEVSDGFTVRVVESAGKDL